MKELMSDFRVYSANETISSLSNHIKMEILKIIKVE